jgi:hypothetical protein
MARVRTMFGCEKSLIREERSLAYITMLKIGKKFVIFVAIVTVRQY